jgi:hypothetical protein
MGLLCQNARVALQFAFITENCGSYGVRRLAAALKAGASSRTPKLRFPIRNLSQKTRIWPIVARNFLWVVALMV